MQAVEDLLALVKKGDIESLVIGGIRISDNSMYTCIYPSKDMYKTAGLGAILNDACMSAVAAMSYPSDVEIDDDDEEDN